MTKLEELPPELLSCITRLLDLVSMLKLVQFVGCHLLTVKCVLHGGVSELHIDNETSICYLARNCAHMVPFARLTRVVMDGIDLIWLKVDDSLRQWCRSLPNMINEIRCSSYDSIDFWEALTNKAAHSSGANSCISMKASFPFLQTLTLGSDRLSDRQDFLSQLSPSLVRLQLPWWHLGKDTHTSTWLPYDVFANLDELEVETISGLERVVDLQNHAFTDFFPNLRVLRATCIPMLKDQELIATLPYLTVLHGVVLFEQTPLPRSLTYLQTSLPSTSMPSSPFRLVPKLEHWSCEAKLKGAEYSLPEWLPTGLKSFEWGGILRNPSSLVGGTLPASVERFSYDPTLPPNHQIYAKLPSLTKLELPHLEPDWEAIRHRLRSLRSVSVGQCSPDQLSYLPNSVTWLRTHLDLSKHPEVFEELSVWNHKTITARVRDLYLSHLAINVEDIEITFSIPEATILLRPTVLDLPSVMDASGLPLSLTTIRASCYRGFSIDLLPPNITEVDDKSYKPLNIASANSMPPYDYSGLVDLEADYVSQYVLHSTYEQFGSPQLPKSLTKLTVADLMPTCLPDLATLHAKISGDPAILIGCEDVNGIDRLIFAFGLRSNLCWPFFADPALQLHTLCLFYMNNHHVHLLKDLPPSITDLKITTIEDVDLINKHHLIFLPSTDWLPNLRRLCLRHVIFDLASFMHRLHVLEYFECHWIYVPFNLIPPRTVAAEIVSVEFFRKCLKTLIPPHLHHGRSAFLTMWTQEDAVTYFGPIRPPIWLQDEIDVNPDRALPLSLLPRDVHIPPPDV